jgi:3-dehydroquinate synthase
MDQILQSFSVNFNYKVVFTEQIFSNENAVLSGLLISSSSRSKLLFVIDKGVLDHHPSLERQIRQKWNGIKNIELIQDFIITDGGEAVKNSTVLFDQIIQSIDTHTIDRHSYIVAIGGGAVLDVVGYAAAVAHRGIRHIRIPSTVLAQNDSGVGVKNGINYKGKKNFLGTFAPPFAVINDSHFLTTLSDRHWRSGIAEAIKVSLIKDAEFFNWLELNATALNNRDLDAMKQLIRRCAELHLQHIAGGDPFEKGSSRPLDFGHWSAHKLEQLSGFDILHGEAVAIGMALDTMYSTLSGKLPEQDCKRILSLLRTLGFSVTHPLLSNASAKVLEGLNEFREHLGGELTIMLLNTIGKGEEVHEMKEELILQSASKLAAHGK